MKNIIFLLAGLIFFTSCNRKKTADKSEVFYTCSMDPQVVSDRPGKCPICGMFLTPVKKSSVTNTDDIVLSEQQVQLGNIHTDTIREGNIETTMELNSFSFT